MESCTGGLMLGKMTDVAGSSGWVAGGVVAYANAVKVEQLGVPADLIFEHGAVSEQTAREMAAGALRHSRAQVAVAITGIAGPGGGSAEKPLGMVCFAWAEKEGALTAQTRHFKGDRERVRRQSVLVALQGLLELVED